MRLNAITRPPRVGTVAPVSEVPPPRATMGTPCSRAMRTAAATCSARLGIDQRLRPARSRAMHRAPRRRARPAACARGRRAPRAALSPRPPSCGDHALHGRVEAQDEPFDAAVVGERPGARAAVAAGRPAVALPVGGEHAVADRRRRQKRATAPAGRRASGVSSGRGCGPPASASAPPGSEVRRRPRRGRARRRRARMRARRARDRRCRARAGRGAPARSRLGVGGVDGRAQRARRRPAAARQRALEARARGLQIGAWAAASRQSASQRFVAAQAVAVGGVGARDDQRDAAAVRVAVRPGRQPARRELRERAGELARLERARRGERRLDVARRRRPRRSRRAARGGR